MLSKTLRSGTITLAVLLVAAAAASADQPPGTATFDDVRVAAIANDRLSLDVIALPRMTPMHLLVRDTAVQNSLKEIHKGDRLAVLVATDGGQMGLQAMSVRVVPVACETVCWPYWVRPSPFGWCPSSFRAFIPSG